MFAVSKQLIKLSVQFSYDDQLLHDALLSLQLAKQQEQNLILEVIGGGLDRFCLYDEVVYLEKAFKTMPYLLSNDPMVVMRVNSLDIEKQQENCSTITLFDRADNKFIEVSPAQL